MNKLEGCCGQMQGKGWLITETDGCGGKMRRRNADYSKWMIVMDRCV
jgi:hypothetical protein